MSAPSPTPGHLLFSRVLVVALVILAVLLAISLGRYVWNAGNRISATTSSFVVVDDNRVEIRFEATLDREVPVTCRVHAVSADGIDVGAAEISLPYNGDRRRESVATIETRRRAVSAEVESCQASS